MFNQKIMLLGSGELGKEFVISAKRLGLYVIAVDRYLGAPAMVMADEFEVIDMLDSAELERIVVKHKPQLIVPEIEAIRTEKLKEFEDRGIRVIPTARATHLTMNRDAIRDRARQKLKLKTANYSYAETQKEMERACTEIGFPCVVKPVMSSSGKGQSVVKSPEDIHKAWSYAIAGMRGDKQKIIVEEFIPFDFEITLLTIKQKKGPTLFVKPIGHRQERGDYQESWLPAKMNPRQLKQAQRMAKKVTDDLGGSGLFGVEFFVTKNDVYFSELSPRPHDTGMVTLISQNLSEFDLHLRAILGIPIPEISYYGASASAVILADREAEQYHFEKVAEALRARQTDVRLFGKPNARPYRRLAVGLARGKTIEEARRKARKVARTVEVKYEGSRGSSKI